MTSRAEFVVTRTSTEREVDEEGAEEVAIHGYCVHRTGLSDLQACCRAHEVRRRIMDFDKYKNPLVYPNEPKKPYLSPDAVSAEVRRHADALDQYDKARAAFESSHRAYNEKAAELEEQFWKDAFEDLGISHDHPKAKELRRIAWDHGHSAGLREVYWWIEELSVFLS
jgi:hypothetical protein